MWHGIQAWLAAGKSDSNCNDGNPAAGWGNPPGVKWTTFPSGVFAGFVSVLTGSHGTTAAGRKTIGARAQTLG